MILSPPVSVTFIGSVLSSGFFLWPAEETQCFCSPQQSTRAVSDHKAQRQQSDTFMFTDTPRGR